MQRKRFRRTNTHSLTGKPRSVTLFSVSAAVALTSALTFAPPWAAAQSPTASAESAAPAAPTAATAAPAASPELKLPELRDLGVAVPRPVRVATALLGLGRQRLALVVGIGTLGSRTVLDSAARDTQAVAQALRESGFVVMQREDLGGADLRAALKEFQERLQPGGLGFVYATALGAQIDGQNVLLPRDVRLDASQSISERHALLRAKGVPVAELVNALMGPDGSPRMLVVDAAWRHPALADLPAPGLSAQRLPPGVIALFGQALGSAQEVPAVVPLPQPAPTKASEVAATPFARTLVAQLLTPRAKAPDALRATRRALVDGTLGTTEPWLGGDTESEELAEATLLDGLVPRTPEELAREAAKQFARAKSRPAATNAANAVATAGAGTAASAGEQSVSEVLEEAKRQRAAPRAVAEAPQQSAVPGEAMRPTAARGAGADAGTAPESPGGTPGSAQPPPSSTLGNRGSALGQAASVAGTVASVAGSAAGLAATAKVAQATATVAIASTAMGAAGSLAGQAVGLMARSGAASSAEAPVAVAYTAAAPSAALSAASTLAPPSTLAARLPPAAATASDGAGAVAATSEAVIAQGSAMAGTGPAAAAPGAQAVVRAARPATPVPAAALSTNPALAVAAASQAAAVAGSAGLPLDGRTVRTADGGERPAYALRNNPFGYAEGDTYTYQVIDTWKDEITGRYTHAIETVLEDGRLVANGQQVQMDAQGRLLMQVNGDGTVTQFEPRQELWWSNPKRGEDRDLRFTETVRRSDARMDVTGRRATGSAGSIMLSEVEWKGSSSVGRLRKLSLPAGEFEVLPIKSSGWHSTRRTDGVRVDSQWSRTVWYSPKLGHPVAIDAEDTDNLGRLLRRERVELVHAQARRGAP